jgi:hypothetical protein
VGFDDLSRLFVLGGSRVVAAKSSMGWLLTRWPRISQGLGMDDECCEKRQQQREEEEEKEGRDGWRRWEDEGDVDRTDGLEEMKESGGGCLAYVSSPQALSTIPSDSNEDEVWEVGECLNSGEDEVVLLPSDGLFEGSVDSASIYLSGESRVPFRFIGSLLIFCLVITTTSVRPRSTPSSKKKSQRTK